MNCVSIRDIGRLKRLTYLALSSTSRKMDPLNITAPVPMSIPVYLGSPLVVFDALPDFGCCEIASSATPFAMR